MNKLRMNSISGSLNGVREAAFVVAVVAALTLAWLPAQAQTFTVLHNFTRGNDGADPWTGLTMDAAGNLYGATSEGGTGTSCEGGCGAVFKMTHNQSGWTLIPLYNFSGPPDGAYPQGRLAFGRDGRLYGTTGQGGLLNSNGQCSSNGCGTIFALQPPPTFCRTVLCSWSEQLLYRFSGNNDGAQPTGDAVFDQAGNLYGTTEYGGADGGTAFELSPSGGGWTLNTIYTFGSSRGSNPYSGLTFDSAGNLYGTAWMGGANGLGVAYQLTPSQSGWNETVMLSFNGSDGDRPLGGLIVDSSGNVYGNTNRGGATGGGGQVYELSPSGGGWTLTLLHSFSGISGPWCDLLMDSSGNVYGTTVQDGAYASGSVFKLTFSNGSWVFTSLHDFNGNDGAFPHGNLVLDSSGNLYGTTLAGGPHNLGTVWEITP